MTSDDRERLSIGLGNAKIALESYRQFRKISRHEAINDLLDQKLIPNAAAFEHEVQDILNGDYQRVGE